MGQEAEFKLRWCMHSLPPHCWKNFGGTLPLLLSTDKNYATKPCTYYFVYHNSEILFNRENFQSPPKSFNTLLPAFYLQQFTSLRSCWRKALMLATQKERYPWDRFVGQRVEQAKLKLLEKNLGDCILCYDGQVIHSHKGEKHLRYKHYHHFLLLCSNMHTEH